MHVVNSRVWILFLALFSLSTKQIAAVVNSALDLYFPEDCGVEIVAELGRYYVYSAFTLAVNIVAKKEVPLDQPGSDGRFGW